MADASAGWLEERPDKAHKLLTAEAVRHRIALCDEIIALLVVTIRQRRARKRK